jgi:hypothetical protein
VKVAAITGKAARGACEIGQERSIWGGFARSRVVEIEAPSRIVESWRSNDFPDGAEDAVLETELLEENGASEIIAAVEQWLAEPSTKRRIDADGTLDPTAQLRFTDRDLGDLFDKRWLYALEAARSAVHALDEKTGKEAALAAVSALEATRADAKVISNDELARVCEAIRAELVAFAG